jgi:hypothetical protein
MKERNAGKSTSTKYRCPLKLIYFEAGLNKGDAIARKKIFEIRDGKKVYQKSNQAIFAPVGFLTGRTSSKRVKSPMGV